MSAEEQKPSKLIEDLIRHWVWWDENEDFYLTKLAPSLVADPESGDPTEKAILRDLRGHLTEQEWHDLPKLIAERRSGILRDIESERVTREALEKEKQETARIAAQKREEETRERLRQEALRKQTEAKRHSLLREIRRRLHSDFLGTDSFFQKSCAGLITEEEFEEEKLSFVKSWLTENTPSTNDRVKRILDDEQVAAIASVHEHIQVVARAGSGKTGSIPYLFSTIFSDAFPAYWLNSRS